MGDQLDPGPAPPVANHDSPAQIQSTAGASPSLRHQPTDSLSLNTALATSSPPSIPRSSRRPSHPTTSPVPHHAPSPNPHTARRNSSAMSQGSRAPSLSRRGTPSPKLMRKGTRQSMGGQREGSGRFDEDERLTPKRSISNLIANLREAQSTMEAIEEPGPEPLPPTAQEVAVLHFARELQAHEQDSLGQGESGAAETVVILHDACYGHRFSRLKTGKGMLGMIVERPERIRACVLGASVAYVRLGEHHAGGKHAPHLDRTAAAPPPFKIRRTARELDIESSCVTSVHGAEWMRELRSLCHAAGDKLAAGTSELHRPATSILDEEKRTLHAGDLYICPESLAAFQGALGGVADAVDSVFHPTQPTPRAFVAVRPPGHHCSADHPSGFCWLNNIHVGIEYAAQTHGLTHAAILDFDLHHGDGSQAITWERNKSHAFNRERLRARPNTKGLKLGPDIGYYSLHDINSYPCEMGDDEKVQAASLCVENAHGQSVWNVHLQPWKTEDEFWRLYEERYCVLLDKARAFLIHHTERLRQASVRGPQQQSKAAIFLSAGFDASEWEGEGMQRHKVNVPTSFYARFTRDVVAIAQEPGTGCEGRVVSVLEGGYSDRALCSGVLSHLSGLCTTTPNPTAAKAAQNGDEVTLDQMMGSLDLAPISTSRPYDPAWWSAENLTALDRAVNPPPPTAPPPQQNKRLRNGPQPTYATPTESFAYKVVDPEKFARSVSGTMRPVSAGGSPASGTGSALDVGKANGETPREVEIDWILAARELSRLLVPTERTTRSYTAEELKGLKKEKEAGLGSALHGAVGGDEVGGRGIRGRKAKPVEEGLPTVARVSGAGRSASRGASRSGLGLEFPGADGAARRQTMHEVPSATVSASTTAPPMPTRAQRRTSSRLSTAGSSTADAREWPNAAPPPPVPALPVKKSRPAPQHLPSDGPPLPRPLPKPEPAGGAEMDRLATGLKRITLKGPGPRAEHDRRAREREAELRRARALKGAETRRVNALARRELEKTAAAVPQPANPPQVGERVQGDEQQQLGLDKAVWDASKHPAQVPEGQQPGDAKGEDVVPQPSSSPARQATEPRGQSLMDTLAPPPAVDGAQAMGLGKAVDGLPLAPEMGTQPQDSLASMPGLDPAPAPAPEPEAASPPREPPRQLPVWSATGPIPFAPVPAAAAKSSTEPGNAVPGLTEVDVKAESKDRDAGSTLEGNGNWDATGSEVRRSAVADSEGEGVWEVPETPRP
ncbi:hypothetical protein B0A50_02134 [Salinomyces thailandicus]|uniref:Histone deacetylase domain-containing protein n=1 Tax=Salinomyces thailandicus TaxID=706561 RepID=A0A4V5N5H6_9PEZI|nr:hypothetical protein B0A50_02134 [Salinomyces thailandica]